jgi:prepilin-type N-terminal cleavage/methylation domain-containing protein
VSLFIPAHQNAIGSGGGRAAFTLIEMLSVTAIMAVLIAPVCLVTRNTGDVTHATSEVANLLETAATYSRANNTYVWVGFFEEDPDAVPARSGTGRIVVSVVASKDGTRIVDPLGPGTGIDSGLLVQVCKLLKLENMHLADVTAPANPEAGGGGDSWDTRPEVKTSHVTYRIGESSPNRTIFPFGYPVGNSKSVPQYQFVKTIQFSPDGETLLNTSYSLVPWIEIGLQPAHGNARDGRSTNLAAIQVSGVTGSVRIYRR